MHDLKTMNETLRPIRIFMLMTLSLLKIWLLIYIQLTRTHRFIIVTLTGKEPANLLIPTFGVGYVHSCTHLEQSVNRIAIAMSIAGGQDLAFATIKVGDKCNSIV